MTDAGDERHCACAAFHLRGKKGPAGGQVHLGVTWWMSCGRRPEAGTAPTPRQQLVHSTLKGRVPGHAQSSSERALLAWREVIDVSFIPPPTQPPTPPSNHCAPAAGHLAGPPGVAEARLCPPLPGVLQSEKTPKVLGPPSSPCCEGAPKRPEPPSRGPEGSGWIPRVKPPADPPALLDCVIVSCECSSLCANGEPPRQLLLNASHSAMIIPFGASQQPWEVAAVVNLFLQIGVHQLYSQENAGHEETLMGHR
ncbi:uncharacterized protein LOC110213979 [Phascolarctos cinereus]